MGAFYGILIAVVIIAIIVLLAINGPNIKGYFGEKKSSAMLLLLNKNDYHIFNNIILKTCWGTTQIDHIVVSQYGIFVIETKNYKGIITGGANSGNWTQNIWGNKYSLSNPIRQNNGHIIALKELLPNYASNHFVSIIAFSSSATLRIKGDGKTHVGYIPGLCKTIKRYDAVVFDSEQVEELCSSIIDANIDDKSERKSHKQNVRQHVDAVQSKIKAGICPRCGGTLVLRLGKYGKFYGCSNYPKCKFTQKVD